MFVVLLREHGPIKVYGTELAYESHEGKGAPGHYLIRNSYFSEQTTVAIFDATAVIGIYEAFPATENGSTVHQT